MLGVDYVRKCFLNYVGEFAIALICLLFILSMQFINHVRSGAGPTTVSSDGTEARNLSTVNLHDAERLPIRTRSMPFSIDVIEQSGGKAILPNRVAHIFVNGQKPIVVRGWAYDGTVAKVAKGVFFVDQDKKRFPATYGDSRPDVASVKGAPLAVACGFSITFPSETLAPGKHALDLDVLDAAGNMIYRQPNALLLVVRP